MIYWKLTHDKTLVKSLAGLRTIALKDRLKFIALAYNAKRFAIVIFFLFLILRAVFGQTAKSFLANILKLVRLEACDQNLTHSLDTSKTISVKIVQVICVACGTWHSLLTVTSIHHIIQTSTKKSQKIRKKLAS